MLLNEILRLEERRNNLEANLWLDPRNSPTVHHCINNKLISRPFQLSLVSYFRSCDVTLENFISHQKKSMWKWINNFQIEKGKFSQGAYMIWDRKWKGLLWLVILNLFTVHHAQLKLFQGINIIFFSVELIHETVFKKLISF